MAMTVVLPWNAARQQSDMVRQAVRALNAGELVAFPTETVYGVAASTLVPDAIERLRKEKERSDNKPLTLAIRTAPQALDWVPEMSPVGRRLARRSWPGPLTLVSDAGVASGAASRLDPEVRRRVCPTGSLGLRVPAHPAILAALDRLPGPLVLTSANRSGEKPAGTAQEVVEVLGEDIALVIDDGPSRYGQASTVVQVKNDSWQVLREGVVSAEEIERRAARMIVFVCTGNTCRSPLAESICKKLLAERLGCGGEQLARRGFIVLSAGLAAMMGGLATVEAIEVGRELGVDLSGHTSRPLIPALVAQADYLIAMAASHVVAIASRYPHSEARLRLLSDRGEDVPDPIGCDRQVYRECAERILNDIEKLLPEIAQ
jgi:protein-tyrosine phosphatase